MSQTYPLVCTRGVILFPEQEIVIDVGRQPSLKAIENAQDNFVKFAMYVVLKTFCASNLKAWIVCS